jgi:hypothetical protein
MPFTDTDLRRVRAEVGSQPSDDDLADAWDAAGEDGVPEAKRWAAVAYQVLAVRYADLVGGSSTSGSTSVSIPGALSVSSSAASSTSPAALKQQLDRLRVAAGVQGGLTGGRVLPTRRRARSDYPVLPPVR